MKKLIPYLFIIGLLASCKTTGRFSIHKRKYNTGFYIEKGSITTKSPQITEPKKPDFNSGSLTKNETAFVNGLISAKAAVDNLLPSKRSAVSFKSKNILEEIQFNPIKETAVIPNDWQEQITSTDSVINKKARSSFWSFLGYFFLTILVIIELACLIGGIYLVSMAASANSVLLGIKLLSIALSLLTTVTFLLLRA